MLSQCVGTVFDEEKVNFRLLNTDKCNMIYDKIETRKHFK